MRPAVEVDLGHERGDERHQGVAPVGRADGEQVLRGAVHDGLHLAQRRAVDVDDGEPDELVVVELLGVLGHLVVAERGVEDGAAHGLGGVAVGELLEGDQQGALVPAGAGDGEAGGPAVGAGGRLGAQRRTGGEAPVGLVGAYVEGDLAADAVGLADPADHDLDVLAHMPSRRTRCRRNARRAPPRWGDARRSGWCGAQRRRSVSTKSTRAPPRPARAETTVRKAVAVRPLRPITLPRSSGWTRTSRIEPRRSCLSRTDDVVGVVDDATHQVLESLGQHVAHASLLPASSAVTVSVASAASAAPSGVSEAGTSAGVSAGASAAGLDLLDLLAFSAFFLVVVAAPLGSADGLLEGLVEDVELGALGLLDLQGALGARQALELLPVAGDLEDRLDGLGGLRAHAEPVLGPVGGRPR